MLAQGIHAVKRPCDGWELSCEFRAANRSCVGNFDLASEPVPTASDRFHEAGALGGVAEGLTDLVDCFVEPVVKIHKGVRSPKFLLQILATHYFACVLDQGGQELKWLLLDSDLRAVLSEFARIEVNLEDAKAKASSLMIASEHEGKTSRVYHPPETQQSFGGGYVLSLVASEV